MPFIRPIEWTQPNEMLSTRDWIKTSGTTNAISTWTTDSTNSSTTSDWIIKTHDNNDSLLTDYRSITGKEPPWGYGCRHTNTNYTVGMTHICSTDDIFVPSQLPPLTKQEKIKDKFKKQLAPTIISRSENKGRQFAGVEPQELVALQLLKQMVSDEQFKRYLKHGFVAVEGPSGLVYQIARKSHSIHVWKNGQQIASLCVYLKNVPPTDDVVAKILICECDEIDIWRRANISWTQAITTLKILTKATIKEEDLHNIRQYMNEEAA
jgi:hypothetical protein